jgi:hypothetical protein
MSYQRKIVSSLCTFISLGVIPSAIAATDPFYMAIAKTQKLQFTEAVKALETISWQAKKRGDMAAAYRSKATALAIQSDIDRRGFGRLEHLPIVPNQKYSGACLEDCKFGLEWVDPATVFDGFGGIITLDNNLRKPDSKQKERTFGILDVVVVPKMQADELIEHSYCKINSGVLRDKTVIALVKYSPDQNRYIKIRRAWYPNLQTKRLQVIPPRQISCADPEQP